MRKKNIFLTGPPRSGKTTAIKEVISTLQRKATGFHTEEITKGNKRVGFLIKTLDGKEGLLAHEVIKSSYHISSYGVSVENIETLAVPSLRPRAEDEIIIIDEIGKMECLSVKFCEEVVNALDSNKVVLGTLAMGENDFIEKVKRRKDSKMYEVTMENRSRLPEILIREIETLLI